MKRFIMLTLFPEIVPGPLGIGVVGRAIERGRLSVEAIDIRDFTTDKHRTVDDTPYGGGGGMVMKPEPLSKAIAAAREAAPPHSPVILMSPQGEPFTQKIAEELSEAPGLIAVCGRYEGFDERIRQHHIDREISLGDYVVSGGELPAMSMFDAVARLIPEVLGNPESIQEESFQQTLLEYPQYTRPAEFEGRSVPSVLMSGNHAKIRQWRLKQSLERTLDRRPELLQQRPLTKEESKLLKEIKRERKENKTTSQPNQS